MAGDGEPRLSERQFAAHIGATTIEKELLTRRAESDYDLRRSAGLGTSGGYSVDGEPPWGEVCAMRVLSTCISTPNGPGGPT